MIVWGWIIYILLFALLYLFWRHVRGASFADLLERAQHEHHQVQRVHAAHPRGGTWREHRRWMREAAGRRRRRRTR